jgi:hypothetical protein
VLLRLAYLGVTNVFALLRLLPVSSRDKDAEILALRHQLLVLQRQLGPGRVRFTPRDRALLAALLHRLPRDVLKRLHLVVRPDTVLRWLCRSITRLGVSPALFVGMTGAVLVGLPGAAQDHLSADVPGARVGRPGVP